jgi:DNA polymerase-2
VPPGQRRWGRLRGGSDGSKKRYAGLIRSADGTRMEFVGLEAVRRDWTPLAKRFQRELLARVFHDEPVEDFIRGFLRDLHAGCLDALLVYKKAVHKELAPYTATTPAHVKAARKQDGPSGRIVEYVMTTAGPEPIDGRQGRLDYDHCVGKQSEPIADAVLRPLDVRLGDVIGRARQLTLF